MRKSIEADKTDIPQLTREQLGRGVRGKYYKAVLQGSNLILLRPEVWKAFPTSEAVNDALSALLALTQQIERITTRPERAPRKRVLAARRSLPAKGTAT